MFVDVDLYPYFSHSMLCIKKTQGKKVLNMNAAYFSVGNNMCVLTTLTFFIFLYLPSINKKIFILSGSGLQIGIIISLTKIYLYLPN
jgi:hypothetical protein